jgi:hypothetical protein
MAYALLIVIVMPVPATHDTLDSEISGPVSVDEAREAERKLRKMISSHPKAEAATSGLVSGLVAGAAAGAIVGPAGAIVGAIVGTALGAGAGLILSEMSDMESRHDDRLDKIIGVTSPNLGEASPNQPPSDGLHFHASSLGLGGTSLENNASDGPIPGGDAPARGGLTRSRSCGAVDRCAGKGVAS